MLKKIKDNKWIIISFITIYIGVFLICSCNMFAQDEYNYSNIAWTTQRIQSFDDIIESQKLIYMNWSGRIPVLGMVQIFLYVGKFLYDLINPLVFILFIFMILKTANKKITVKGIFTVLLFVVFGTYKFWEKYIWISGSLNYLWTVTLMLIVMYYLYNIIINDKKINILNTIILLIISFLAGWSHENTAFVLGSFIIFLLIFNFKKIIKLDIKTKIKVIASIVLFGLGAMILIFCPGNFGRLEGTDRYITFLPILKNIAALYKIIIIYIITIIILKKSKSINESYDVKNILNMQFKNFICPIILAAIPMIIISEFPVRAALAYEVMLYIIILQNLQIIYKTLINKKKRKFNIIIYSVIVISVILLYSKAIFAFGFIRPYRQKIQNQINESISNRKTDIVVSEFEYMNAAKFMGVYMDVFPKKTDSSIINAYMSIYYKVNSITAVKDEYAQVEVVLNNEENIENYDVINKETGEIITDRIRTIELSMPEATLKGRLIFEIPIRWLTNAYIQLPEEVKEKVIDIKIRTNEDICGYDVNNILINNI